MERIHIVVAEDDPIDLVALKQVLDQLGIPYSLTVAVNGEEARDLILMRGRYQNLPPPDLIFLDMNMPKLSGLEVLQQIPGSAQMCVCVLTSSERERRLVEEHFAPKKISYLIKPIDREQVLKCLKSYDQLRPIAQQLEA
ncbi:MAG: response regulator [Acidobacteriota bacterium]|nr:response regulator [Acidobacteriota bacterium]